ncbi:DNA replication complex GINS family protein [Candidatus Woesearchaeota archaeon]|nr:DNA replication complex GINS family protein [Candidatus Woesearchaeota archaeon]
MEEEFSIEHIYDVLRKERLYSNLQEIDKGFFIEVARFIKQQEDTIRQTDDIKESSKQEKQLESIKKVIKEIYEKRELKIIQLALSNIKTNVHQNISQLLDEEKELYNSIVEDLDCYRSSILENINKGMAPELKPKEIKTDNIQLKTIRFVEPLSRFIGTDLNVYGPFKKEYIANLPLDIADYLIKNNKAEEI